MGRVRMNRKGMVELLQSQEVQDWLEGIAEEKAAAMAADAPVDEGTFAGSFSTEVEVHPTRAVARIVSDDPKSLVKESRFRTMTRGLDA